MDYKLMDIHIQVKISLINKLVISILILVSRIYIWVKKMPETLWESFWIKNKDKVLYAAHKNQNIVNLINLVAQQLWVDLCKLHLMEWHLVWILKICLLMDQQWAQQMINAQLVFLNNLELESMNNQVSGILDQLLWINITLCMIRMNTQQLKILKNSLKLVQLSKIQVRLL